MEVKYRGSIEKDSQEGFTEVKETGFVLLGFFLKKAVINLMNAKSIFSDVSLMSQRFCHSAAKSLHSFSSWSPESFCFLFRTKSAEPRRKENSWRTQ